MGGSISEQFLVALMFIYLYEESISLYYCSYTVSFEIRLNPTLSFSKSVLTILDPLYFHINFRQLGVDQFPDKISSKYTQNPAGILIAFL